MSRGMQGHWPGVDAMLGLGTPAHLTARDEGLGRDSIHAGPVVQDRRDDASNVHKPHVAFGATGGRFKPGSARGWRARLANAARAAVAVSVAVHLPCTDVGVCWSLLARCGAGSPTFQTAVAALAAGAGCPADARARDRPRGSPARPARCRSLRGCRGPKARPVPERTTRCARSDATGPHQNGAGMTHTGARGSRGCTEPCGSKRAPREEPPRKPSTGADGVPSAGRTCSAYTQSQTACRWSAMASSALSRSSPDTQKKANTTLRSRRARATSSTARAR